MSEIPKYQGPDAPEGKELEALKELPINGVKDAVVILELTGVKITPEIRAALSVIDCQDGEIIELAAKAQRGEEITQKAADAIFLEKISSLLEKLRRTKYRTCRNSKTLKEIREAFKQLTGSEWIIEEEMVTAE
ncbi:MAG: hypothetical protein WCX08_03395 [Candidatus Buchananbacteria bacterium]|jgi:hypothetical protein